jgi:hypothetical protein
VGLIATKDKNAGFNPCGQTLRNKQLQNPTKACLPHLDQRTETPFSILVIALENDNAGLTHPRTFSVMVDNTTIEGTSTESEPN